MKLYHLFFFSFLLFILVEQAKTACGPPFCLTCCSAVGKRSEVVTDDLHPHVKRAANDSTGENCGSACGAGLSNCMNFIFAADSSCAFFGCDLEGCCYQSYLPQNTSCVDANCNAGLCSGNGFCQPILPLSCGSTACVDATCNPLTRVCTKVNTNSPCSDNNSCTTGDTCSGGICRGVNIDCNDGNVCTTDFCRNGSCFYNFTTNTCNDGLSCTINDVCSNGTCRGTSTCNDNNTCTDDSCSAAGCIFTFNTAPCNDGNNCTSGDRCSSGSCFAGSNVCGCQNDTDCNDQNVCTRDTCNTVTHVCTYQSNDGVPCDDGDPCNGDDTCSGGQCSLHGTSPCERNGVCKTTCIASRDNYTCADSLGTRCDDGLFCNGQEQCDGQGNCVSIGNLPCQGISICDSSCNEQTDTCFAAQGTNCSDGIFCNGDEICNGGGLCLFAPQNFWPCAAGGKCNGVCNETARNCFAPQGTNCSDNIFCNGDEICDGQGTCTHISPPCSAACHVCNETSNTCDISPDGSLCTSDQIFCNGIERCMQGSCVASGNPCSFACASACVEGLQLCDKSLCSPSENAVKSSSTPVALIGGVVGGVGGLICIIIIIVIIVLLMRRKKEKPSQNNNSKGGNDGTNYIPMGSVSNIISQELVLEDRVGKGNFGEVFRGKLGRLHVACKRLSDESTDFLAEVQVLSKLKHPNIVEFIGMKKIDAHFYMVMEYMNGGSLLEYVRKNEETLQDEDLLDMASQIAAGMAYLEEKNIIHKDLALRNILCTIDHSQVICKVSDFGLSKLIDPSYYYYEQKSHNPVAIKWSAPEVLFKEKITPKADVYSFGIVMYELFSRGEGPWLGKSNEEVIAALRNQEMMPVPATLKPSYAVELMKLCWNFDYHQRPNFQTVVKYLDQIKKPKPKEVQPEEDGVVYNTVAQEKTYQFSV